MTDRSDGGRMGPTTGAIGTRPRPWRPGLVVLAWAALAVAIGGCGLLAPFATPGHSAEAPSSTPTQGETPGPAATPTQGETPGPAATPTPGPTALSSLAPWLVAWGGASGYPPLALPAAPTPNPTVAGKARPTRVAIPGLDIDLAVVVAPKSERWPLCDVAEYLRSFDWPGQGGTTYIYSHAQRGMFLPILVASWRRNGQALLGDAVFVWTDDDRRYEYRITRVRRHQRSLAWAFALPPESLVLQTSENQYASGPKVMLIARLVAVTDASHGEAHPRAKPRRCG